MALLYAVTSISAIFTNAYSMCQAVLALVQIYQISPGCCARKAWISWERTTLESSKSHLLPTSRIWVSGGQEFLISEYQQVVASSKDCLSVMSKTIMRACAPRQYELVMVLKRQWPAVSQICSLTLLPLRGKDLNLKSTPIVAKKTQLNQSSAYRTTIDDFPTQELPTSTTLKRQWYSP